MDLLVLLSYAACVLLGIGRGLDLAFGTDLSTGLCTVGSAWWRYIALGVVLLLCFAAGRVCASRPRALCRRRPLAGWLAATAAVLFCVAAAVRLAWNISGIGSVVRAVLEVLCALWLWRLCRAWQRRGEWLAPSKSLVFAILGSAVFYWCVLARFMENSSSWHRPTETAMVWQYLAALVFLAALARALYVPESANGKALCAGGLCTFALCLCWQLPQTVADFAQDAALVQPETYFGLGLCFVGALGGVCAGLCLHREQ